MTDVDTNLPYFENETVTLTCDKLVQGGLSLCRGETAEIVFVKGLLPGESGSVRIGERVRSARRGTLQRRIDDSAIRVIEPCEFRRRGCGGCDYQHISVEAQPTLKRDVVVENLQRIVKAANANELVEKRIRTLPSEIGYRTTARFARDLESGQLGFRGEGSNDIVPIASCLVLHEDLQEILAWSWPDGVTEVVARTSVATGERAILATTDSKRDKEILLAVPDDGRTSVSVAYGKGVRLLRGNESMQEQVGGRLWNVSIESFFQSGPWAAELLINELREVIEPNQRVVDVYAGVGILGGSLQASQLFSGESGNAASSDAFANFSGDNTVRVQKIFTDKLRKEHVGFAPDVVVADPSRTGLGRSATNALSTFNAPSFVLVACDSSSFARDVGLLREASYELESVRVLDLFPHTSHVETLGVFRHK